MIVQMHVMFQNDGACSPVLWELTIWRGQRRSEIWSVGIWSSFRFFFVLKKNCAFKAPLVLKVFTLKVRCTRRLGEKINLFKRESIVYLHHLHFFCFLFKILFDISFDKHNWCTNCAFWHGETQEIVGELLWAKC